jgi:hypothetical protein
MYCISLGIDSGRNEQGLYVCPEGLEIKRLMILLRSERSAFFDQLIAVGELRRQFLAAYMMNNVFCL